MHDKNYITKKNYIPICYNTYLYSKYTKYGNLENETSKNIKITIQLCNTILIIVMFSIILIHRNGYKKIRSTILVLIVVITFYFR